MKILIGVNLLFCMFCIYCLFLLGTRVDVIERKEYKKIIEHEIVYQLGNNYKTLNIYGDGITFTTKENDTVFLCDSILLHTSLIVHKGNDNVKVP